MARQTAFRKLTSFVSDLARHYHRSPDLLNYDEVADWLFHLVGERKLASSSVNIAVNSVRFLYRVTLGREAAARIAASLREANRLTIDDDQPPYSIVFRWRSLLHRHAPTRA